MSLAELLLHFIETLLALRYRIRTAKCQNERDEAIDEFEAFRDSAREGAYFGERGHIPQVGEVLIELQHGLSQPLPSEWEARVRRADAAFNKLLGAVVGIRDQPLPVVPNYAAYDDDPQTDYDRPEADIEADQAAWDLQTVIGMVASLKTNLATESDRRIAVTDANSRENLQTAIAMVETLKAVIATEAERIIATAAANSKDKADKASDANATTAPKTECFESYVTLDQMAASVSLSKRTLQRHDRNRKNGNQMPNPDVEGGGGKAHRWKWSTIRPWLEATYKIPLPEKFPHLNEHAIA